MPTIEERIARYAAQLDDAARARVPATPPAAGGLGHGPGRRVLVAAFGVGIAAAIALGIAIANHGDHPRSVPPAVSTTGQVATTTSTPEATSAPSTSTAPTTTAAPTPPTGTQQLVYEPFVGGRIDPRLHVTARLSGSCVAAGSQLRCFASTSGAIYDPCFQGPQGTAQPLVCPHDPISPDVVAFTATSVSGSPTPAQRPWAMQLENGQVCLFVSAAWGGLGPYSCPTTTTQTAAAPKADCHEPSRSQPWWTAACQEQLKNASPFVAVRVLKVWF